jgi:hypothetical protein
MQRFEDPENDHACEDSDKSTGRDTAHLLEIVG